jgi:hypothetical protein
MSWTDQLNDDPLSWLLEGENPGVSYLALRDLCDLDEDAPKLIDARERAHREGPIASILAAMEPEGYWVESGAGYYPKYRGTVWSLIALAQLGGFVTCDERIRRACDYLLDHSLAPDGQFSVNGAPSGTADCLQGNLCAALSDLGIDDPRLEAAYGWMARSVTGEGVAPMEEKNAPLRYYAGKCGPLFACGSNNKLSCAWGGVKVMLAFGKMPMNYCTPLVGDAIKQGVDFFLGVDPATAGYPNGWSDKPSGNWWKFGFPVFYVTDLLQLVEAMVRLGYGDDARLMNALQFILSKQDASGRWALEYDYSGKTWVDFGVKKQSNKWVTYRVLQVLRSAAVL